MRVVLDTNILARATPGKSGPATALRSLILPPHILIASPYLLSELAEALRYDHLRKLHGLTDSQIDQYTTDLQENAVIVSVLLKPAQTIVPDDPKDDPIVQTAVAGQAEYLCTLDKHLFHRDVQAYCSGHGIRVVTDI